MRGARALLWPVVACALAATGCGDDGAATDAGPADAGAPDGRADAGIVDAGALADAAGADGGPPDAGAATPRGPVLYPTGRRHSPLTDDLVARLREIAAEAPTHRDDVFAKVGDSITVSRSFLHCLGEAPDLSAHPSLAQTRDAFASGDAGGSDPFRRTSLAATVGWSASAALAGAPSPLEQEVAATRPRFAVVMFGTNDIGFRSLEAYADDMLTIVDRLLAAGVVPLLSTIPPRDDDAAAGGRVPEWNLAVRAIAQGRGVPLVDLHAELEALPGHGLSGDGVHPRSGGGAGCAFDATGLQGGYNVRNLITLEQLDRAHRALARGEPAPDAMAPRLVGDGSAEDPFRIPSLPFVALHDTRDSRERDRDEYPACAPGVDESGPELTYALSLSAPAEVRATVVSRDGVDVDVHLLDEGGTCVGRDHRTVTRTLPAGEHRIVVDSFVSRGAELAGEYLLVVR